jgi:hypothetical protein
MGEVGRHGPAWRTEVRSSQLDLRGYDTDKIKHGYLQRYDPILAARVDQEVKLLELGVYRGGSLLLWRDYFPQGTIVGIDLEPVEGLSGEERIQMFQGSQGDKRFLTDVATKVAPEGFDIIIDDASHIAELTRTAFWHLFENHLKPSGLYVIEDWGTGYWDDWPDGKRYRRRSAVLSAMLGLLARMKLINGLGIHSHTSGMVGFVKELVDEQGAADLTRARLSGTARRMSKFESITVTPSMVVIAKVQ